MVQWHVARERRHGCVLAHRCEDSQPIDRVPVVLGIGDSAPGVDKVFEHAPSLTPTFQLLVMKASEQCGLITHYIQMHEVVGEFFEADRPRGVQIWRGRGVVAVVLLKQGMLVYWS